ncbi:MAG: exopolyphosphatase, partial [Mycobacterium sp.]|nr:exopolyphosphatase [Mycobacterium sp.]
TAPPSDATVYGLFTPGYVPATEVPHVAVHPDGTRVPIAPAAETLELAAAEEPAPAHPPTPAGLTRRLPLGTVAGARSGDKGGSANIGLWVRTDAQYRWLTDNLTVDRLRQLLPEATGLTVTRHLLPGIRAVNFVIDGILGRGVAYQARFDPQAKGLGEWLRSRHVEIPEEILPEEAVQ